LVLSYLVDFNGAELKPFTVSVLSKLIASPSKRNRQ
jgi:hypothetical protein